MCPSKFVVLCLLLVSVNAELAALENDVTPSTDREKPKPSDFEFLVTGGYRPETNQLVKHVVSLRLGKPAKFFGDNHFCAGSIISQRAILTAAHCFFNSRRQLQPKTLTVFAGTPKRLVKSSTTQMVAARKLLPHPKYKRGKSQKYDVGLVFLKQELRLGDAVRTIPLYNKAPTAGLKCFIIGWGTLIHFGPLPDEVVNGDVKILPDTFCQKLQGWTRTGMLCANDEHNFEVDSCQGDSGGPLICDSKVAGIVSFGTGCGEPDLAGIYTDVYHFRTWINENSGPPAIYPLVALLILTQLSLVASFWGTC